MPPRNARPALPASRLASAAHVHPRAGVRALRGRAPEHLRDGRRLRFQFLQREPHLAGVKSDALDPHRSETL